MHFCLAWIDLHSWLTIICMINRGDRQTALREDSMTRGSRLCCLPFFTLGFLAVASGQGVASAELTYFGRSSVKIKTASGLVVYIDPYAPGDYSEAADLILVTHGHSDHNRVNLVARKSATVIAAPAGAVTERGARDAAEGATFTVGSIAVRVLPAAVHARHLIVLRPGETATLRP